MRKHALFEHLLACSLFVLEQLVLCLQFLLGLTIHAFSVFERLLLQSHLHFALLGLLRKLVGFLFKFLDLGIVLLILQFSQLLIFLKGAFSLHFLDRFKLLGSDLVLSLLDR